jgi:hypothetical protein
VTAADPRLAFVDTQTQWGASRYGEWRRCRKAHHLRYHLGLVETPIEDDPIDEDDRPRRSYFATGRIVHGVHRWMREGAMLGESREWRAALDVTPELGFDLECVYEAERLVHAYYALWGTDNAGFPEGTKILAVEHEMCAPERSPIAPYTARADAIVELASGEIVIVDDKTRAQAFPKDRAQYARGAATRPQFLGLSWLLRAQESYEGTRRYRPSGVQLNAPVWINAIIKTKIVKVDRIMVPFTHAALDQWALAQAADAAAVRGEQDAPANYSACAPEIGSRCQYFTWCHGTDEERAKHFTVKGNGS